MFPLPRVAALVIRDTENLLIEKAVERFWFVHGLVLKKVWLLLGHANRDQGNLTIGLGSGTCRSCTLTQTRRPIDSAQQAVVVQQTIRPRPPRRGRFDWIA